MSIQLLFNRVVYLGRLFPGCQQGGLFTLLLDICAFFNTLAHFQGCTVQCCLRSVNFRGIRFWRSKALCVSDGCNLSFQCCSPATDQQLVAAGGIWWASGMQQLMFFMMQS